MGPDRVPIQRQPGLTVSNQRHHPHKAALTERLPSDERTAFFTSLIVTAKLNAVDPQAWLADVLARIAEHRAQRLDELLPWNWSPLPAASSVADQAA